MMDPHARFQWRIECIHPFGTVYLASERLFARVLRKRPRDNRWSRVFDMIVKETASDACAVIFDQ